MLGPTKWRLLTIVAGILLAHAIDSPVRSPRILSPRSSSASSSSGYDGAGNQLALSIQRFVPWNDRYTRNLYSPYDRFSNIDNIRITTSNTANTNNMREARNAISSFRYSPSYYDLNRRSDDQFKSYIFNASIGTPISSISTNPNANNQIRPKPSNHKYIPLLDFPTNSNDEIHQNFSQSIQMPNNKKIQSRTDVAHVYQSTIENPFPKNVVFPSDTTTTGAKSSSSIAPSDSDLKGRRSGIQFSAQPQTIPINVFIPQGYREDNPNNPNFQFPYSEELSPSDTTTDVRFARGIAGQIGDAENIYGQQQQQQQPPQLNFPQNKISQTVVFRDDVTKFGDINGPITSMVQQRQFSDSVRNPFDTGGYYSSDEFGRSPRLQQQQQHYFPPKSYVEYSEYPGPPRNRLQPGWKSSRTPRVVFPQGEPFPTGSGSGNGVTGTNNYNLDNVVFR